MTMDGIELEILWSNLIGIVSEQAKALQRIAFSPVVREAGDLASGLFDARGRMVAQANTGTPGHINSLCAAGLALSARFDGKLVPGDVVITNDPWMSAGHFFDITVLCPIFWDERLIGYIGSTTPTSAATASARVRATCMRKGCGSRPPSFTRRACPMRCCTTSSSIMSARPIMSSATSRRRFRVDAAAASG
jgi:hypothetical protein